MRPSHRPLSSALLPRRGWSWHRGPLLLTTLLLSSSCHLGRPAVVTPLSGFQVLPVLAPVAEPELAVVLRREIGAAMAARGMMGDGPAVQVEVLSSTSESTAVSSEQRGERSHLRIEARVLGADPASVLLEADLGYLHSTDLGSAAAVRRADAQERLAIELASQLVEWLATRPQAGVLP